MYEADFANFVQGGDVRSLGSCDAQEVSWLRFKRSIYPMLPVAGQAHASVDRMVRFGAFVDSTRRDGRVADCAALEMLCARKGTGGSNPPLSALF